jgi:hypothetical protein
MLVATGKLMLMRDVQPINAIFPMLAAAGKLMLVRDVQSSNALYPMLVNVFGPISFVNALDVFFMLYALTNDPLSVLYGSTTVPLRFAAE